MLELIVISQTRDHDCEIRTKKRLTELKKLSFNELEIIIDQYYIKRYNLKQGNLVKEDLINGIILHEKMLLGNKQTEMIINIDNKAKSYFIETANKFVLVTKKNLNNREIYNVKNNLCSTIMYTEILCEKKEWKAKFLGKTLTKADNLSILKDIKVCRKAIMFVESFHFYLKVRCLLHVFDTNGIDDIIRNICFVYFERTLSDITEIRCRL